jgi:cell fate regulator YaaT (PSP1 superfamily)
MTNGDANGKGGPPGGGDGERSGGRRRRRGSRSRRRKSGPDGASPDQAGNQARPADGRQESPRPPRERPATESQRRERPAAQSPAPRRNPAPRPSAAPRDQRPSAPAYRRTAEPIEDPPALETDYLRESEDRGDFTTMDSDRITFLKPHEIDEELLLDVAGIKLHPAGLVMACECIDLSLDKGDPIIVETGRGLALGEVVVPSTRKLVSETRLPRVIRKASQNDMRQRERNVEKERAAFTLCREGIEQLRLPMKLISVDYLHGGNKAVFYFASEGRVDFRDLVRELARRLHIRVEMRQIGVRDAARMLGGIGSCGQPLCCNRYLREFTPVSIRMAKNQDLVLNPEKVSGICGRLLCCLAYEDAHYREAAKNMPRVGRRVITPDGEGRVRDRDVLRRIVRVQVGEEGNLCEYTADQVRPAGQPGAPPPVEEDDEPLPADLPSE